MALFVQSLLYSMTKEEIISGIHTLVSNNVIGPKQLMSRYKGFRAELLFKSLRHSNYENIKMLDGGITISKDSTESSLINSIYFTITANKANLREYEEIYGYLSGIQFESLYLLFPIEDWKKREVMTFEEETISLMVPDFEILKFNSTCKVFENTNNEVKTITDFFKNQEKRNRNI